jgi:hypothetical protein
MPELWLETAVAQTVCFSLVSILRKNLICESGVLKALTRRASSSNLSSTKNDHGFGELRNDKEHAPKVTGSNSCDAG